MSEKNLFANEDPIWRTRMQMLTTKKRNMEIAQIIDSAIFEYYSEKGLPVPQWKQQKNPQWWVDYLTDLGLDSNNNEISNV